MKKTRRIVTFITAFSFLLNYIYLPVYSEEISEVENNRSVTKDDIASSEEKEDTVSEITENTTESNEITDNNRNDSPNYNDNNIIYLEPESVSCYYGQPFSGVVRVSCSIVNTLPTGITVPETLRIKDPEWDEYGNIKAGEYEFEEVSFSQYTFKVASDARFSVTEYDPEESAYGSSLNNFYTDSNCKLTAPSGFLISTDKRNFYSEIDSAITETTGNSTNTITYYLKNDNEDSPEYGAVSVVKQYTYSCVSSVPVIESVTFRRENSGVPVNIVSDIGVIARENIIVTIRAKGNYKDIDSVYFNIYDESDNLVKKVSAELTYGGSFEGSYVVVLPEGEKFADESIKVSAVNEKGNSFIQTVVPKEQAVNHIIIDNADPVVNESDIKITYVNDNCYNGKDGGGFFVADGIVSDFESGIARLEYKWDFDNDYYEYSIDRQGDQKHFSIGSNNNCVYYEGTDADNFMKRSAKASEKNFPDFDSSENSKRKNVHFRILVPYGSSYDVSEIDKNQHHTLYLKITDFEGHESVINGKFVASQISGGKDTTPPKLTKFDIKSESEINFLLSGNYSSSDISFILTGKDESETSYIEGVKNFKISGKNNVSLENKPDSNNSAEIQLIKENIRITDARVSVADNGGNTYSNSVSDEINKMFIIKDENAGDEDKIDVPSENLRNIKSDTFVVDTVVPYADYDVSGRTVEQIYTITDESGEKITKKDVWFNSDSQQFSFTFKDDLSGIFKVNMRRNGLAFEDGQIDFSKETVAKNESTVTEKVKNLETGTYIYSADISDNALNPHNYSEFLTVNVDKERPSSEISIMPFSNPNILIDNAHWVDASDNFKISVTGTDNYSGISKINLRINGDEVILNGLNEYEYSENRKLTQTITVSRDELNKQNIIMNDDHTYVIEYSTTDFAGNTSKTEKITVHVDTNNPTIDSVEVKKVEINGDKINNSVSLLPFGIFSNTSLTFRVKASDVEHDSGIKEIRAYFNKNDDSAVIFSGDDIKYIPEENCYEFTVQNIKGILFRKSMKLEVEDNFGKVTAEYKDVVLTRYNGFDIVESSEDEFGDSFVNVTIEDIAPEMLVTLPEPDYKDENGVIWFNGRRRKIFLEVNDDGSGLSRVSASLVVPEGQNENNNQNIINLEYDSYGNKLIVPEDVNSVLNEEYTYTFLNDGSVFSDSEEETEVRDGKYILRFSSVDNSGNINTAPAVFNEEYISTDDYVKDEKGKTIVNQYTYNIDTNVPEIVKTEFEPVSVGGISDSNQLTEEPEEFQIDSLHYGLFFKTDFALKVYPEDNGASSGLRNVYYRMISYADISQPVIVEKGTAKVTEDGYAVINIKKGFKGRIVLSADDNVGNVSAERYLDGFVSEDTAPEVLVKVETETDKTDADGNKLYTGDVLVKVTVSDSGSGIKDCRVRIDSEKTGENGRTESVRTEDLLAGENGFNGWTIEEREANLVTRISKTFVFSSDDNNIFVSANAHDNSENELSEDVRSQKFTIDKTAPVINVSYSEGFNGSEYYNKDNPAVVTLEINERNYDASLVKNIIENTYSDKTPSIEFTSISSDRHKAVITFPEGDFIYSVTGSDLAGHDAQINDPSEGRKRFFVDETAPKITTNFESFINDDESEIYFNGKQKVKITVDEHNFDQNKINLAIMTKQPGSQHNEYDMNDNLYSFVKYSDWKQSETDKDIHTLEFEIDRDSVYQLIVSPEDKAGNKSSLEKTEVFEIDTTVPKVKEKNGESVSGKPNETEFLDIYTSDRKDDANPSIKFDDVNFDHLEFTLVKYVPESKENRELGKISPEIKTGTISSKEFVLDDFADDGTYSLEIKAVDKAGNSSIINKNTYVKMIERDVLAYIPDSSIDKQSGLFSVEYENGEAISKRPDSFSDIDIVVMARSKEDVKILLRDTNGDEKDTMLEPESEDVSMYGLGVYSYKLKREFFVENYQNDIDSELFLTVKNADERIDIARIHIDNISPTCETDKKFRSWYWYLGNKSQKIVVTDISELLNESECKVYDKGIEIPFDYSAEAKTLSFTLDKGWHDIGVHLEDYAGNEYDIQQVDNIHIGNFWLWVILGGAAAATGTAAFLIIKNRKRNS